MTGSTGKTTAAKLIRDLLDGTGATVVAGIHMNNGRYLWRAMSKLTRPTDFVVQELGVSGPGGVAELTDYLTVDVAVVTTVGYDHNSAYGVPYSGAPEAIATEKGKLVEAVSRTGLVCLNADDARVAAMASRTGARTLLFGQSEKADVRAIDVAARWPDRLHFTLLVGNRRYAVRTCFIGTIMLPSVLAALAVVHGTGRDLQKAIDALALAEPARRHMSVVNGQASGKTYLVDTEKASLWSTQILADDMQNIGGKGVVFVLGEMSDMRSGRTKHYASIARKVAAVADRVILTGAATSAERRMREEGIGNVFFAYDLSQTVEMLASGSETLVMLKSKTGSALDGVIPLIEQRLVIASANQKPPAPGAP